MLNTTLANFYERDIRKLIEEVNLFGTEEHLWQTRGTVKNSSGNLVLHIVGGMNYLIGATLANTGYIRDRDQEFLRKGVERTDLIVQLEKLIPMINETMNAVSLEENYPLVFDDATRTNGYVLMQLFASFKLSSRTSKLSQTHSGTAGELTVALKFLSRKGKGGAGCSSFFYDAHWNH